MRALSRSALRLGMAYLRSLQRNPAGDSRGCLKHHVEYWLAIDKGYIWCEVETPQQAVLAGAMTRPGAVE